MEGRKGLLGIVKKGLCKRKAFGSKKGGLLRIATKGLCKRKALGLCKMVQVHLERFSTNENVFSLRKGGFFSSCKAI